LRRDDEAILKTLDPGLRRDDEAVLKTLDPGLHRDDEATLWLRHLRTAT
jgi:hypothetical protein